MIEWNDSLLVGFEPIDAEHKTLTLLIGELYRRLKSGAGRAMVEDALFTLADHVAAHFNHENELMIGSGYPDRSAHLVEHRILIDQLDTVLDGVDLIEDEALLTSLGFVERWFLDHVHDADAKLGAFLGNRAPSAD
ncbi:MAG: bacteriohemerythrin [Rhodospirillaceae bacterium]